MYRIAFAPAAVVEAQAALGLALSRNDPEIAALLEYWLAQSYIWGNDHGKAVQHGENSLQLYRQLEDLNMELVVSNFLGSIHTHSGNFEPARFHLEGNLALAPKLGH